jgi:hypothetical protein
LVLEDDSYYSEEQIVAEYDEVLIEGMRWRSGLCGRRLCAIKHNKVSMEKAL